MFKKNTQIVYSLAELLNIFIVSKKEKEVEWKVC